jgi:hypothetical protein
MTSQSKRILRLKYLLSRYGTLVIVALVLTSTVAFAGAALAYTAPPETRQITEQTDRQSFKTTVNTSAAVTGNTTLYESGRNLSNMPIYFFGVSPELTVNVHTELPDDRAVEVTQQTTIELYATRGDDVFWSETRTLAADTRQITDGNLLTQTTIDVQEIRNGRLREAQSEVQNLGVLHAKIHVDTAYRADAYQGSLSVTAPMEFTDRSYAIEAPQSDERSHATPVTRTITNSSEAVTIGTPVTSNGTALAGILPSTGSMTLPKDSVVRGGLGILALTASVIVSLVYGLLPDREGIKRAYDKTRYGDWVSKGEIPRSDAYERITIREFVDLIDIAIDSNKRVIRDPTQGLYAVIDGTTIYQYSETPE